MAGQCTPPTVIRLNGKTTNIETSDTTVKITCSGANPGTNNDIKDFYIHYRDSETIDGFSGSWLNLGAMTYAESTSGYSAPTPDYGMYRIFRIQTRGIVSGTNSDGKESAVVYRTYPKVSCPIALTVSEKLSYFNTTLEWTLDSNADTSNIAGYNIQWCESLDGVSWDENNWSEPIFVESSPLEVSPPDTVGRYYRYRIQSCSNSESIYNSDWFTSDDAILRKDMAPFDGFTDPKLTALSTKIKAIHMTEMQNRINDLLLFNGKEAYSFTEIVAGETKLSGWTSHVTEIRQATDLLRTSHEDWIEITENRPRVDVMTQLRDLIIGYCKVTITVSGENGLPENCVVTVRNVKDSSVIAEFTYTEPQMVRIEPGTTYFVECSESADYNISPVSGEFVAEENSLVSVELMYRNAMRYGFKREKANSDPSARITYLYDAEGMTPMSVNLTTGEPDYGSWETFIDELCRPVMLKSDGTVDYELDHDDQTKKLDGTASDISNTGYDGNAMVEFRKYTWVSRSEDDTYEYVVFSNAQCDDTYSAYANTNAAGDILDSFYWGMYEGCNVNGTMRSLSNVSTTSTQTATAEISQAETNGSGWYIIYKSGWDFIIDILTLLSKSDNSQTSFGYGVVSSGVSAPPNTGTLVSKPAFCGYSNGTSEVKALYMEGLWGGRWERVAGLIQNKTSGIYVKMTPPYNTTGDGYIKANKISGSTGNFVSSSSCTDAIGYLPHTLSGSETTYMCDKIWYNETGVNYALIGGRWTLGTGCGARSMNFAELPTSAAEYTGARLSYLNPAK